MTKNRILLVEDHTILREGIKSLLAFDPTIDVVGEAEDGLQAVSQANLLKPDLILMDLSLPLMNGSEAMQQIKGRNPDIKVIVMTVHNSDEHVRASLDAGADGYLLKDDTHQDLVAAIRSVIEGGIFLSPKMCGRVVSGYLRQQCEPAVGVSSSVLTGREREVLIHVAEGYKNRETAERLGVSVKTVEKHRANLMKKLDLHSAAELTAYAIANGLMTRRIAVDV